MVLRDEGSSRFYIPDSGACLCSHSSMFSPMFPMFSPMFPRPYVQPYVPYVQPYVPRVLSAMLFTKYCGKKMTNSFTI